MIRNVFVNQTLTARTVGLVGGVLAGLALALTGSFVVLLLLHIYLYLRSSDIYPYISLKSYSYSFILFFFSFSFPFPNRSKCFATDVYLHPEKDGFVSFTFSS